MNEIKKKKLEKDIIRIISLLIVQEKVKDPRVSMVSMHRADITDDLTSVKIYITAFCDKKERNRLLKGLKSAAPFIQSIVGKQLRMRITPRIEFIWDDKFLEALKVNELIDKLGEDARKKSE